MSNTPTSETDRPDDEPDRQADAMKDQLRKDVASWSAARSGAATRQADEFSVPVVQAIRPPSLQPAKRVRRAKPIAPEAKPSAAEEAVQHVLRRRDAGGLHHLHDRSRYQVNWVTFEAAGGGLVVVSPRHVVAIYDEQGTVKLATTAGGVHVLKDMTVQQAAAAVTKAADAEARASD